MADNIGESIGSLYVEVQARTEKLQRELLELREKVSKSAKEISAVANVRPNLDDRLLRMKISDLRKEHARLKAQLEKQIQMDVRADSLTGLKRQIGDVEKVMRDAGVSIQQIPKGVEDSAKKSLTSIRSFSSSVKDFIVGNLATIGVFVGVQQFLQRTGEAIKLAKEQAKAEAQVEQAIRQTGQAAGFTAQQLFREASALQEATGVGDEVSLQRVTKQLLTFTNVVGDNFIRAQKAVLDLNAVINEGNVSSLSTQSIQLGKALENPVQGISALTRSGITFTDQQKELIKSLAESGKMFAAQSIILDEIEAKYGGQAKALAGAEAGAMQMSAAFGDFLERAGKRLLPFLETANGFLTRFFNNLLSDAPRKFADQVSEMNRSALDQVSKFDQLVFIYEDLRGATKLTAGEQKLLKETIGDLQKLYPSYLKNIDLEAGKLGDVQKAFTDARLSLQKYLEQRVQLAVLQNKESELVNIVSEISNLEQGRRRFKAEVENALNTGIFNGVRFEDQQQLQQAIDLAEQQLESFTGGRLAFVENQKKMLQEEIADLQKITAELFEAPADAKNGDDKAGITIPVKLEPTGELDIKDQRTAFEKAFGTVSEAQKKVFDELKFGAQGYLGYRIAQIQLETEEFIKAGAVKADAEALAIQRIKGLYNEYFAYLDKAGEEKLTRDQERLAELAAAQEENFDFISAGFESFSDGFETMMQDIRISSDAANSALEKGFIAMANTFIAQVQRMAAEWAAFQLLQSAASAFGIALPGKLLGKAAEAAAGATGGRFAGTPAGVKRMATGGSFIVPPGFQGDSYPLFVQSGERVSVTPAGQVAQMDAGWGQIRNAIEALNLNLMTHRSKFEFRANIEGALKGRDLELSYDRQKRVSGKIR